MGIYNDLVIRKRYTSYIVSDTQILFSNIKLYVIPIYKNVVKTLAYLVESINVQRSKRSRNYKFMYCNSISKILHHQNSAKMYDYLSGDESENVAVSLLSYTHYLVQILACP